MFKSFFIKPDYIQSISRDKLVDAHLLTWVFGFVREHTLTEFFCKYYSSELP